MADKLNDADRLEADQHVQETRGALRKEIPREGEPHSIADVIVEDDLEDMDADGVEQRKQ